MHATVPKSLARPEKVICQISVVILNVFEADCSSLRTTLDSTDDTSGVAYCSLMPEISCHSRSAPS